MPAPRTDISPHVESLLQPGEMYLNATRRNEIIAGLREQFPNADRSTLNSAIVRVLRERRKNAQ